MAMRNSVRGVAALSLLRLFSSTVLGGENAAPPLEAIPNITVLVYNYARVPAQELAEARGEVERILRPTGVGVEWDDYPLESPRPLPSQGFAPTTLALRIVPRAMAQRYGLGSLQFGFALPAPEGQFGSTATVFYRAAEGLAASRLRGQETLGHVLSERLPARAMILGHLMAHAIGHLLLGRDSHSRSGIMHVPWGRLSLNRAASGKLLFTAKEAQRIRAQLLARSRATKLVPARRVSTPDWSPSGRPADTNPLMF
jgi:hypothetical protein